MQDPRLEERRAGRRSSGVRARVQPRTLVAIARPKRQAGRVLVVVEDSGVRNRLASALRAAGLNVIDTRVALEALERAAESDLAIVDLQLGGASATLLIEDLLRRRPGLYAIMLGGEQDDARIGYRAGADNWVRAETAPLDVVRLVLRSFAHARSKGERAQQNPPRRRFFRRSALWVSLAGAVLGALLAWAVNSVLKAQDAEDARMERLIRALEQQPPKPSIPAAPPQEVLVK